MPRFSWDTLPVSFHCSNSSAPIGMYSPESLQILAKFAIVTIDKYQGMDGFFLILISIGKIVKTEQM